MMSAVVARRMRVSLVKNTICMLSSIYIMNKVAPCPPLWLVRPTEQGRLRSPSPEL